jgi:hypothetical protein
MPFFTLYSPFGVFKKCETVLKAIFMVGALEYVLTIWGNNYSYYSIKKIKS